MWRRRRLVITRTNLYISISFALVARALPHIWCELTACKYNSQLRISRAYNTNNRSTFAPVLLNELDIYTRRGVKYAIVKNACLASVICYSLLYNMQRRRWCGASWTNYTHTHTVQHFAYIENISPFAQVLALFRII